MTIVGNGQIINGGLDRNELKLELLGNEFLVIKDFFKAQAADRIFHCLDNEVNWELAYRTGADDATKSVEQLKKMSGEARQQLQSRIIDQARGGYQFSYFRYPMIDAYLNKWTPRLMLNDVLDSMNSQESLDFLRDLTGDHEVKKVELQATNYAPGHFLKLHNDNAKSGDDRRYACVVSLTKDWESHWGGLLQFVDNGHVTSSFAPRFNTCIIFKVPRDHLVSYVAPFATKPRYSLTGWLRAD